MTWGEVKRAAKNKVRWRNIVDALCSRGNHEEKRVRLVMQIYVETDLSCESIGIFIHRDKFLKPIIFSK